MTTTPGVAAATTLPTPGEDRVSAAARHLYEAESALHIARQTGVDAWIATAYDHLHPAVIEYRDALAAACGPTAAVDARPRADQAAR